MSDGRQSELISRRNYLGMASGVSAAAAIGFSTLGMLRLPKPRVLPGVAGLEPLGHVSQFPPDTVTPLPEHKVCVFSTPEGIAVLSLVCTHLGCIVKKTESGFDCPCHGSRFGPQGELVKGPAPHALAWFAVSQAADGTLLVDTGKEVEAGVFFKI